MDADRLLDGLSEAQRRAVTDPAAPLAILAGAGSGKTRVLARRIAWRAASDDLDPRRVLALTFTRKAAGELGDRLRRLGLRDEVAAGTFHGVAYAQLRARWADQGVTPPALITRKASIVGRLLRNGGEATPGSTATGGSGSRGLTVGDAIQEIEWAQARLVDPADYPQVAAAAGRRPPADRQRVAALLARYREEKQRRHEVDFDDLLRLAAEAIETDPTYGEVQRWRFRHLFVDEFQDVNPLQFRLLTAWLGGRSDLCVVGDPHQAIYAWNGADASYLRDFTELYPGASVVELTDNYRSSPQILAVAGAVLGRPAATGTPPTSDRLRARRPDGPLPVVRGLDDGAAEAAAVARAMRDHHPPGSTWASQAVLVRTNAQTTAIVEALTAAGIPARVRGGAGLLDRPEVKRYLAGLRRASGMDLAAVLADLDDAGRTGAEDEVAPSAGLGAGPATSALGRADLGAEDDPQLAERRASFAEVARLAHSYRALDPGPSVPGFVAWLETNTRMDAPDRSDAVTVATFHSAKGLEWRVVHLAGLEDGFVPIGHARTGEALEEERRLLHVAVTRAEQVLLLTWARKRTFGTRTLDRQPSPFLAEVEPVLRKLEAGSRPRRRPRPSADPVTAGQEPTHSQPTNPHTGVPVGGARLTRPPRPPRHIDPGDHELWVALQRWRADVARAADVPTQVVIDDVALDAAVTARPSTEDDLAALVGFGPVRVRRYGRAIIEAVAAHPRPLDRPDAAAG